MFLNFNFFSERNLVLSNDMFREGGFFLSRTSHFLSEEKTLKNHTERQPEIKHVRPPVLICVMARANLAINLVGEKDICASSREKKIATQIKFSFG